MRECLRLLSFAGLREVYESSPLPVRTRCDALLRHSLFVARLASGLARLATVVPPALAFTAGLLHDIGRVVLCVKCDATVAELPSVDEADDTPAVERVVYGVDHCTAGCQFATHNNLPEAVIRTTLNHHRPEEEQLQRPLVAVVAVAERVACHVQQNHTITDYALAKCPRFAVLSSGWGKGRAETFRVGLASATVLAIRDTRKMLKAIA
jgi:putative nucleotidyltransferase with HDIG domain